MKIRATDTLKVQAVINEVAGKASTFIANAGDLEMAARRAELILEEKALPIALRTGACMTYTPVGPDSNGYKYGAISIRTTMIRTSSGWWVTKIERCKVYPKNRQKIDLRVSAAQAAEIRERSTADLTVAS
jgi:hypothetical protein